jgi:hypothetical protein
MLGFDHEARGSISIDERALESSSPNTSFNYSIKNHTSYLEACVNVSFHGHPEPMPQERSMLARRNALTLHWRLLL